MSKSGQRSSRADVGGQRVPDAPKQKMAAKPNPSPAATTRKPVAPKKG